MRLRHLHPDDHDPHGGDSRGGRGRLTLLLSYDGGGHPHTEEQLARLLAPQGIDCVRARCGEEATDIIRGRNVHIAVVDLSMPLRRECDRAGGARVLQLLRRLDPSPPTVVIRPPQALRRESARTLSEALREGAFAVVDRPVQLETLLEVMRRVVRRHYADHWPAA